MKTISFILIFIICSQITSGNSQICDYLILDNDTLCIYTYPLENSCDSCKFDSLIVDEFLAMEKRFNPERYKKGSYEFSSTICYRGYIALWQIINNRLILNQIRDCGQGEYIINLSNLFELDSLGICYANWFSGEMTLPIGECIEQWYPDDQSVYEKELVLNFNNGILKDSALFYNRQLKKSTFSMDPNFEAEADFIYNKVNWDSLIDLDTNFISVNVGIQPDSIGQIESILWTYTYALDYYGVITNRDNIYIREAIRIAKLIPDWDVIFRRNKIIMRPFTVLFSKIMKNKYAR